MISAGDIQFESPMTHKILPLTSQVLVLTAGESTVHADIVQRVKAELDPIRLAGKISGVRVGDVAEMYSRHHLAYHMNEAEKQILGPLGLDTKSFISQQHTMLPDVAGRLTTLMLEYESPGILAIITGTDQSGGHIYVVDKDCVRCSDNEGFAAIGAGNWHAESQFMFAHYAQWASFARCMLLSYTAKKRAEVAPGVGPGTDMFAIMGMSGISFRGQPTAHPFFQIPQSQLDKLEAIYATMRKKETQAIRAAEEAAETFYEELENEAIQAAQKISEWAIEFGKELEGLSDEEKIQLVQGLYKEGESGKG
jgi:hypothetical protein